MTRSEPLPPDRATAVGAGTGVTGVIGDGGVAGGRAAAMADDAIRRELARLTVLLRRHFSQGGEESLLPMLADTSDPAAAEGARAFLAQIRMLAEALEADARRWADSAPTAGAFADFRREALALLAGVEERIAEVERG